MSLKDVLAIVTSDAPGESVIPIAEQLARRFQARLTALVVNWQPSLPMTSELWVGDPWWGDMLATARTDLNEMAARINQRLTKEMDTAATESALLEFGAAQSVIGGRARHADLTVVARPHGRSADGARAILEGALFDSGRPVLIAPPEWKPREIGLSVLVCWKTTREAARALGDAQALLSDASRITVLTVDAQPSEEGYGPHPGADITSHLARCGYKPDLVNAASAGRTETKAILDQAAAVDADLIVMGGFGRSRFSEFIFGGVTREILETSGIPILMAH